jgi:hypothetical protein
MIAPDRCREILRDPWTTSGHETLVGFIIAQSFGGEFYRMHYICGFAPHGVPISWET